MDCPVCGERLKEIERASVMVDICPSCKGVWLDRGEIEKIIEVEARGGMGAPPSVARADSPQEGRRERRECDDDSHDYSDEYRRDPRYREGDKSHDYGSSGRPRRSSLLSELLGGLGGD